MMTPLVRRWFELAREAYDVAARPRCTREMQHIVEAMDDEDRAAMVPHLATLRTFTAQPETPETLRVTVGWLHGLLAEHGVPLH
jgi:hypothetical protein